MHKTALTLVALLLAPALSLHADCDHSKPLDATLDASGAKVLEIEAEAGFLRIEGSENATEVRVDGQACASSEKRLGDIELQTRREGDRLVVRAKIRDFDSGWGRNQYARLDLTIDVPAGLPLEVTDGSGELSITNVASLDLEDGSGEIDVRKVSGDVRIRDGSGEIDLQEVAGGVKINDGSGSLWVREIQSNVVIKDGSGEIDIADVRGDVEIDEDGSGGIDIRDVTGHVLIGSDGSGSIRVAAIGGDFTVRSDGSGGIQVDGVEGAVKIP